MKRGFDHPRVRLKIRGQRAVEMSEREALARCDGAGLVLREPELWESDADQVGVDFETGEIRATLRALTTRDGEVIP